MALELTCPSCSKRYRVPDRHAGKTTRCKHCHATIPIPDAPAPEAPPPGAARGRAAERAARPAPPPPGPGPRPRAGRWWKIALANLLVLAGLAGGLGYYFSTQRGDYERLISAADAAAAGKDVHLACTRYDALFERAKSEQVPRSVLPSLDAAMQRWRDLVTAEVNDADGRARAGDLPAAAQRYLAVQKLSSAGVVPESSTDQVAAALSRHRRLYLDLIDAAATRQRDGDFVAASEKYRQLHGLSRSADLPMAVDADVRDALERRWPELYRRQITEARQLLSGGDKPGACKLFAALLGERGQEVPSAVAEELKSALAQAVQTCGDKPR